MILLAELDVSFAERLKELRKEKGLTQYKLAEELGVSRGLIGNYEQGTREPDHKTTKMFADYFNVTVDYLLGYTNTRISPKSVDKPKGNNDDWYIAAYEGYQDLPPEGKEQMKEFLEFLKVKYGKER